MAFPSAYFFFNDEKQGWSERYWYYNKDAPLNIVVGPALELFEARTKMLAQGVRVPWGYVSQSDVFRDIVPIKPLPKPGDLGYWNQALGASSRYEPNVTLVARMFSLTDRAGKYTYLSGVPSTAITYPPLYNPEPQFTKAFRDAFNAWATILKSGIWGWKAITFGGVSTAISNITIAGNAFVVSAPAFGGVIGVKVKLSGVVYTGVTGIQVNSTYTLTAIGAGPTFTLDWGGRDFTGFVYQGKGSISAGDTGVQVIGDVIADKIGSRKRGVGFGQPHGRLKKRK